jgi:hypothetical protein
MHAHLPFFTGEQACVALKMRVEAAVAHVAGAPKRSYNGIDSRRR